MAIDSPDDRVMTLKLAACRVPKKKPSVGGRASDRGPRSDPALPLVRPLKFRPLVASAGLKVNELRFRIEYHASEPCGGFEDHQSCLPAEGGGYFVLERTASVAIQAEERPPFRVVG